MTGLFVPEIPEDCDLLRAALLYAAAGWYVGPLHPDDPKNPGYALGKGWQHHTTRDIDQIIEWFTGTPYCGVFLHCGRSGAVVFDMDRAVLAHPMLVRHLWNEQPTETDDGESKVPFQSTREAEPGRGHYLMLQPNDRMLGNGVGKLDGGWGEVRGTNGVIVVEPSRHPEPGGRYRWMTVGNSGKEGDENGVVPPIHEDLLDLLPAGRTEDDVCASDAQVEAFMATHTRSTKSNLMKAPVNEFKKIAGVGTRHDTAVKMACWLMREAAQGFYPARTAANELWRVFHESMKGEAKRWPKSEYRSIIAWAIGQAMAQDQNARREETWERLRERDRRLAAERGTAATVEPGYTPVTPTGTSAVAGIDPFGSDGFVVDPAQYFADKSIGLDVALLATHVLDLGPLAVGLDSMFWRYEGGVWRPAKKVVKHRVVELLGPRYRQAHATNTTDVVDQRSPEIFGEPVEQYLNCQNGMVDWRTGRVTPHDPGYFSTVQFPFEWDPDATCPRFDEFLESILSPDYVHLAWQMIGYLLYSGNPLQRAFMLHGGGNNGKGTLLRVIEAMLGAGNCANETITSLNTSRFASLNLVGKIANLAGDMDATFQTDTAIFKAITGEDTIAVERKFGDSFHYRCWAVPVVSVNKIPGSADATKGYLRRWLMLEFDRTIEDKDVIPGYSNLLLKEVPGIATKAIRFLREVMQDRKFYDGGDVAAGQDTFAKAVDQVRQWVDEACIPAEGHAEDRSVLYASYRTWATANGVGQLKASEFYSRLVTAGYAETKIRGVRRHKGLRVLEMGTRGSSYGNAEAQGDEPWVDN